MIEERTFDRKISEVGNSLVVTIPHETVKTLRLKAGHIIKVMIQVTIDDLEEEEQKR